ncbi:hypothetical protein [Azospirillum sp.]|uniref:hypothetical protein n=1 Tax=Azospirillum sp. TaxID=34012 RepID=UPI003D70366A
MIDRSSLFRTAHTIARRERGMYGIHQTYREAFALALRRLYAQAKERAEREARREAFRATLEQQARERAAERIATLKAQIRDLEHCDRLGREGIRRLDLANRELRRLEEVA